MRLSRRVSGSRGRGARPATHSPRQAPRTANPHAAGASKTLGEIPNPVASGGPTNKNPRLAPRRGAELPTGSCAGRGGAGEGPGGWGGAGPSLPQAQLSTLGQRSQVARRPRCNPVISRPAGKYSPCWPRAVLCAAARVIKRKHNMLRPYSTLETERIDWWDLSRMIEMFCIFF